MTAHPANNLFHALNEVAAEQSGTYIQGVGRVPRYIFDALEETKRMGVAPHKIYGEWTPWRDAFLRAAGFQSFDSGHDEHTEHIEREQDYPGGMK